MANIIELQSGIFFNFDKVVLIEENLKLIEANGYSYYQSNYSSWLQKVYNVVEGKIPPLLVHVGGRGDPLYFEGDNKRFIQVFLDQYRK